MGEHKLKAPGEIKGQEYRQAQRRAEKVRARWVVVAELSGRWYEKRWPGYTKRKAEERALRARKEAEAASKGKGASEQGSGLVGPKLTDDEKNTNLNREAK